MRPLPALAVHRYLLMPMLSGLLTLVASDTVVAAESNVLLPTSTTQPLDFGHAVAVTTGWVAVGAPFEDEASGAVYLFACDNNRCQPPIRVRSPDPDEKSSFGAALALSADQLVVGSPERDHGVVDVFMRQGNQWVHDDQLVAFDGNGNARFGATLALQGGQLLVGAPRTDSARGAAYAFSFSGGNWSQAQRLVAPVRAAGDQFGYSVALAGTRAWIGAPLRDADGTGPGFARGMVSAFERLSGSWINTATIVPTQPADAELFGWSLALQDGYGVVGAPGANGRRGRALVLTASGGGWTETATLLSSNSQTGDRFGWSLSAAGVEVAVGAPFAGASPGSRCGRIFQFRQGVGPDWSGSEMRARNSERSASLGWTVASDADSVVGGAPGQGSAGGALRFEQQVTVFADGYEGGESGCAAP
ncbi:MAG: hypothetical protein ACT4NL_16935 [Pseudomarimonas sp.]